MVLGVILIPLLLGVVNYGYYFWQAQRSSVYAPRIPLDDLAGTFTCTELVARVTGALTGTVANLSDAVAVPLKATDIVSVLVRPLSGIGADVTVSVRIGTADSLVSLLPLPNDGALLSEVTTRLDRVNVSTKVCE